MKFPCFLSFALLVLSIGMIVFGVVLCVRSTKGAVASIFTAGWVKSVDVEKRIVKFREEEMSFFDRFFAKAAVACARCIFGKWLECKMKEWAIKQFIDGVYARYVL